MKQQEDLLPGIDDTAQAPEGSKPDPSDDPCPDCSDQRDVPAIEDGDGVPAAPESAIPSGGKRARIKPDQVQQIADLLGAKAKALPVVSPAKTTEAAIKVLAPKIRALLRRGCPLEEIASDLREHGLPIATGTLRGYLPRKRKKKPANSSKTDKPADGADGQAKHDDGTASPTNGAAPPTRGPNPLHPAVPEGALS